MYRNTLNYQVELRKNHPKLGTMTGHEKKMNKADLRSFRHDDHKVHSMVPGLSNIQSVGSLPTKRIGQVVSPERPVPSPDIKKTNQFKTRNRSMEPNSKSVASLPQISQPSPRPMTNLYSAYMSQSRPTIMTRKEEAALTFERGVDRSQHNPLTNPLNDNEGNPYIRRQKKLILGQMAMS